MTSFNLNYFLKILSANTMLGLQHRNWGSGGHRSVHSSRNSQKLVERWDLKPAVSLFACSPNHHVLLRPES